MQRISGTRRSCSICGYTDRVNDPLFRSFQQSSFPAYHSFIVSEYNYKGFATLNSMPLFSCDLTICCSLGYKHPISTYQDMFYESNDWKEPSPYLLLRAQFAFHQLTHPLLLVTLLERSYATYHPPITSHTKQRLQEFSFSGNRLMNPC